jgi:hypothetical protein
MSLDLSSRSPEVVAVLRWFESDHLTNPEVRAVFEPFRQIAWSLLRQFPDSPELVDTLKHLRAAKDGAVRCRVLLVDPRTPDQLTRPCFCGDGSEGVVGGIVHQADGCCYVGEPEAS